MKLFHFRFCAAIAALQATTVLSKAAPTPTTTSTAPSCTASLIASLCSYPTPGPAFAVASPGKAYCWDYCNAHQPCDFVIFAAGNPSTGDGTCWLYPGESYDPSKGSSSGCGNPYLSVYNKPVCAGGSSTTTAGACAATATQSAVASVCGYPVPPGCDTDDCIAAGSVTDCLGYCADATSCNYVVYNPSDSENSPYATGTCWIYPKGKFNAGSATPCAGQPTQYVYDNLCPKPSHSTTSHSSASATLKSSGTVTATATGSGSGSGSGSNNNDESAAAAKSSTNNAATATLLSIHTLALSIVIMLWRGVH